MRQTAEMHSVNHPPGFLQFVPIIGPSFLVAALAVSRLLAGEVFAAALVFVLGGVLVGWQREVGIANRPTGRFSQSSGQATVR